MIPDGMSLENWTPGISFGSSMVLVVSLLFVLWGGQRSTAQVPDVKVKDFVKVDGAVDNEVEGIGIVVGLQDSGDEDLPIQRNMLRNYVNRFFPQLDIQTQDLQGANTALVEVQATLPAFQKSNTTIDVSVSSMGNAESLAGGHLLNTFLRGPDKQVYAVAQGDISISGNHLTTAKIPDGARIIREISSDWIHEKRVRNEDGDPIRRRFIRLNLKQPNWNGAKQIAAELRRQLNPALRKWVSLIRDQEQIAVAEDRSSILVQLPLKRDRQRARKNGRQEAVESDVSMVSDILGTPIQPSVQTGVLLRNPRIIINEDQQTWAIQGNVMVAPVSVRVPGIEAAKISQPQSLQEFLEDNELSNEQVISIIKALKQADAIQGEVIIQ